MRAGTENVHSIAGLAKAMEISFSSMNEDKKYILDLKKYMIQELKTNLNKLFS
jgi:cysteine desulfurase